MKHFSTIKPTTAGNGNASSDKSNRKPSFSKSAVARELGLSRQSLYYRPKLPDRDFELKARIEAVMQEHDGYGYRRIANALELNPKRIRRVMKLFGLKPKKAPRRPRYNYRNQETDDKIKRKNLLSEFHLSQPNQAWNSDFTYIRFQQRFVYLATILDAYTREIVAWLLRSRHDSSLITDCIKVALSKREKVPLIFHSDQGSEYCASNVQELLTKHQIQISMSKKASPWQNPKQESFYQKFKRELGSLENYPDLGELMEAIAIQIHYYNHKRIHSALKMPPAVFYQRCCNLTKQKLNPDQLSHDQQLNLQ